MPLTEQQQRVIDDFCEQVERSNGGERGRITEVWVKPGDRSWRLVGFDDGSHASGFEAEAVQRRCENQGGLPPHATVRELDPDSILC
jgi:hypothetical protein